MTNRILKMSKRSNQNLPKSLYEDMGYASRMAQASASDEMDDSSPRPSAKSRAKKFLNKKSSTDSAIDASLAGKYHPFVVEQLKKRYTNAAGKQCYAFKVGARLGAFEKFFNQMAMHTNCQFFANHDDDVAENKLNIVANTVDQLAAGIKIVADTNTKMKTHGITIESRAIPIDSNLSLAMGLAESVITTDCPAVSYDFGACQIIFKGPADQLNIATSSFETKYEVIRPKPKGSKPKAKSSVTLVSEPIAQAKSKAEIETSKAETTRHSAFMKQYLAQLEDEAEEVEITYDADGNVVSEVVVSSAGTDEVDEEPVHRNCDFKPPSKADQMKRVKASGGSKRVSATKAMDFEPTESVCHGLVTKLYGGAHVEVRILTLDDDDYKRSYMGHISGSMSRKSKSTKSIRGSNRLEVGCVVLVSKRDFQDSKVDIVQKIPSECVRDLITAGYIHRDYTSENPDRIVNGAEDDDSECGFVFEDI